MWSRLFALLRRWLLWLVYPSEGKRVSGICFCFCRAPIYGHVEGHPQCENEHIMYPYGTQQPLKPCEGCGTLMELVWIDAQQMLVTFCPECGRRHEAELE